MIAVAVIALVFLTSMGTLTLLVRRCDREAVEARRAVMEGSRMADQRPSLHVIQGDGPEAA